MTITESRKRFDSDGYDRHKIFLYKEDFNKFIKALGEAVDYVKTELMPDFDFDAFNHDENPEEGNQNGNNHVVHAETEAITDKTDIPQEAAPAAETTIPPDQTTEEVDKW